MLIPSGVLEKFQSTMGIEGIYKECFTIEATFTFETSDYTSTFIVLDANNAVVQVQQETGVQIHGILSTDFLIKNKWIIDE